MSAWQVERLDPSRPEEIAEYERTFYAAFRRAAGNRLIRKLWLWDDEAARVRTRIPYDAQILYAMRDERGRLVTAMGVNTAMQAFQSEAYGFSPPRDRAGSCEFLTVFSVGEYRLRTRFQFRRDSFADLARSGFHTAYATTARRVLNLHVRGFGGRVLEEREIEGEARYFLAFDLER